MGEGEEILTCIISVCWGEGWGRLKAVVKVKLMVIFSVVADTDATKSIFTDALLKEVSLALETDHSHSWK